MDLLISDVHFGSQGGERERWKERLFAELLGPLRAGDRLLLLGDIFDVWIGWHSVVPAGYHRVLSAIDDARARGAEVHFVVGNHDFAPGRFLEKRMGVRIHREPVPLSGPGSSEPILLAHGDEPPAGERSYRVLRRVLRFHATHWVLRMLPADATLAVGRLWSRKGRSGRPNPREARLWLERYHELVVRRWWAEGHRIVISGHHHVATLSEEDGHVFVNLGHWLDGATWGEIVEGKLTLWRQGREGSREVVGVVETGEAGEDLGRVVRSTRALASDRPPREERGSQNEWKR